MYTRGFYEFDCWRHSGRDLYRVDTGALRGPNISGPACCFFGLARNLPKFSRPGPL